jgi:hypothetical protein
MSDISRFIARSTHTEKQSAMKVRKNKIILVQITGYKAGTCLWYYGHVQIIIGALDMALQKNSILIM